MGRRRQRDIRAADPRSEAAAKALNDQLCQRARGAAKKRGTDMTAIEAAHDAAAWLIERWFRRGGK